LRLLYIQSLDIFRPSSLMMSRGRGLSAVEKLILILIKYL